MKRPLATAAALLLALLPAAAREPSGGRFIRVDHDSAAIRLQTGVTRYEKDGASVDLIGAVHIADRAYYESLNRRFESYEVLLFEMIGGEDFGIQRDAPLPEDQPAGPEDPAEERQNHALHLIYHKAAAMLQLVGQADHIDYHAKNFLHADLTSAEFAAKQAERGESLLGFLLSSSEPAATPPNPLRLLHALVTRRADLLKLALINTLGEAESQIDSLAGESAVITDRNLRCLEVLQDELDAGRKTIGIFYGAAHFPDLEERLLALGFTRSRHEWVTAWNIPRPPRTPDAAPSR